MPVSQAANSITVKNVAGLLGIQPIDGQTVITRGYYVPGDGGGNEFVYHRTGRPTPDGGFYINGPGADDYFEAVDKTVANVLQFGAVGDGVADDRLAWLAAISSGAKAVKAAAGRTYLFSQEVAFSVANQTVDLNGSTLLQAATAPWVEGTPGDDWLVRVTASNVTLKNGTLQGNGSADDVGACFAHTQANLKFENLTIKNFGEEGLSLFTCSDCMVSNIYCTNNHIQGAAGGTKGNVILNTCTDCQADNITIVESLGKGLSLTGAIRCNVNNLMVTRDTFSVANPGGDGGIYLGIPCADCVITNVVTKNVHNKISRDVVRCTISNFFMETTGYDTLQIQGSQDCRFYNGTVIAHSGALYALNIADHASEQSKNNEFHNCKFLSELGAKETIMIQQTVGGSGTKFFGCNIEGKQDSANLASEQCLIREATSNVVFENCRISYTGADTDVGCMTMYGTGWQLSNCRFTSTATTIEMFAPRATGLATGCTFTGTSTTHARVRPLTAASTFRYCEFVNLSTYYPLRVSVAGCKFEFCRIRSTSLGVWQDGAGIEATEFVKCHITGNSTITNSTTNRWIDNELVGTLTHTTAGTLNPGTPDFGTKTVRRVATVAAMVAMTDIANGVTVNTQGYTTAGDGGGNSYIYRSSGWSGLSSPDGVGFYIRVGATDAYFEAVDKTVARIEQFGGAAGAQAALDAAAVSGKLVTLGTDISISTTLTMKSFVTLDLQENSITQTTNNIPIIKISGDTLTRGWAVKNGALAYATQQTTSDTSAFAIQLGDTSKFAYLGQLEDLHISKAHQGICVPALSGCYCFLVAFRNIYISDSANYGFYFKGDAAGGHTNIIVENVWVHNASDLPTGTGFYFFGINGLNIANAACDAARVAPIFQIESCHGTASVLALETAILGGNTCSVDTGTDVITQTNHGYAEDQAVRFGSTSSYPSPLAAGTTYYAVSVTTNTYKLALTPGGAAIDLTTAGSGTLICTKSGISSNFVLFSNSKMTVDDLYTYNMKVRLTGASFGSMVRFSDGSRVRINHISQSTTEVVDASTDNYYAALGADTSELFNNSYTGTGGSPGVSLGFGETPYLVRRWDGSDRQVVKGSKTHTYRSAAPTSGTWAVGDMCWNVAPSAAVPNIGWVCVTAGTPGTWLPMGSAVSTETSTSLDDVGHAINTANKFAGKMVWNTTTSKPVYATGSAAGDVWVDATGATAHTPV